MDDFHNRTAFRLRKANFLISCRSERRGTCTSAAVEFWIRAGSYRPLTAPLSLTSPKLWLARRESAKAAIVTQSIGSSSIQTTIRSVIHSPMSESRHDCLLSIVTFTFTFTAFACFTPIARLISTRSFNQFAWTVIESFRDILAWSPGGAGTKAACTWIPTTSFRNIPSTCTSSKSWFWRTSSALWGCRALRSFSARITFALTLASAVEFAHSTRAARWWLAASSLAWSASLCRAPSDSPTGDLEWARTRAGSTRLLTTCHKSWNMLIDEL